MIRRYLDKFPEISKNVDLDKAQNLTKGIKSLEGEALAQAFKDIEITEGWETALVVAGDMESNGIDSVLLKKALLRSERL